MKQLQKKILHYGGAIVGYSKMKCTGKEKAKCKKISLPSSLMLEHLFVMNFLWMMNTDNI